MRNAPADRTAREGLRRKLGALRDDAELIGDEALVAQADGALKELERGGAAALADRVLVVDCPEDEQVRRVGARSGLAPAEVRAIMATQLKRADRLARADDVIDNSGPPGALAGAVARLDASYRALAAARRDARP